MGKRVTGKSVKSSARKKRASQPSSSKTVARRKAPTKARADASPTKEFFLYMLVRDIQLIPAVIDLVDNSVDGARAQTNSSLERFTVRLEVSEAAFRIADNCGGIPLSQARDYAFRFGRDPDMPPTPHSIGQFGVGMKRSLFKLGKHFRVTSRTTTESFVVDVDIDSWQRKKAWDFDITQITKANRARRDAGTWIEVSDLHEGVMQAFKRETFLAELRDELQSKHREALGRGLNMTLNTVPLSVDLAQLYSSSRIKPAYATTHSKDGRVSVKIYAGVADSDPVEAGWYLFCNGRAIVEHDQTLLTGWGEGRGRTLPKYHNQFARFRGYVFFDSDDASALPWNTTKTGVDADAPIYVAARTQMIRLARPVITFLNHLDAEKDDEGNEQGELGNTLEKARLVPLARIAEGSFSAPNRPPDPGPEVGRIRYQRPKSMIEAVMRQIRATTYRDVGEQTFDYFYEREIDD